MPNDDSFFGFPGRVPQADRTILAAGNDDARMFHAESQTANRVCVPSEAAQAGTSVDIPQPNATVAAPGSCSLSVGGESHSPNLLGVTSETAQLLPCGHIPQAHG